LPSRFRVPLGYAVGILVFVFSAPTPRSLWVGLLVALPGELLRMWASGHIEKTRALATGGPYAHTRNPLYLGSSIMVVGVAIAAGTLIPALLLVLYVLACYPSVIREEAGFLERTFPEYGPWAAAVPAFVPRLGPAGPRSTSFSWRRVLLNREWEAALAVPGMVLLFALRRLLPWDLSWP
jgi:protein-S-isoprenylcysteine O-methyltransferase Ste14